MRAARSLAHRKRVGRKHGDLYVPRESPAFVQSYGDGDGNLKCLTQSLQRRGKLMRDYFGQPSLSTRHRQTLHSLTTASSQRQPSTTFGGASYTLRRPVEAPVLDFSRRTFCAPATRSTGGVVLSLFARAIGDRTPELDQNFFQIVPHFAPRLLRVV